MELNEIPNRVLYKDGQEYLYFGGTNYLGITTNPDFQRIICQAVLKWGSSYGSSRMANIRLDIYEKAEKLIARQMETEASLTISSGMLAAKLALEQLQHQNELLFHLPNTHPALLHPSSLPLIHNNKLNQFLFDSTITKIGIVADAIPSLAVTAIDLDILNSIPTNKKITLLLDESHSIGLLGNQGQGVLNQYNYPNVHSKISIASLGKAMGLTGGIIAGPTDFIDNIKQQQNFVGSSGMNPAFLESFVSAQSLYYQQRQELKKKVSYVAERLLANDAYTFSHDYPVIYFDNDQLLELLEENNIIPTSFPYPTASGKLSRIVISAHHWLSDLDRMVKNLNTFTEMESGVEGDIRFLL